MLTVDLSDLFSVYLLSRVDTVIRYIEVDFTFGLQDYVHYIEVSCIEVLFHTFYCNFGRDVEYRSLYRIGSLNRGSTVLYSVADSDLELGWGGVLIYLLRWPFSLQSFLLFLTKIRGGGPPRAPPLDLPLVFVFCL